MATAGAQRRLRLAATGRGRRGAVPAAGPGGTHMSSTPAGPDPAAPGCPLPRLPAGDAQLALHLPLFDQVDAHHLDAVRSVREDNETGLLTSADLHVAATVLRLTGHTGADLAAVIARVVAAARAGSSCLRLNPEQARLLRSHQQPDGPGPGTATGTVALVGTADRPAPIRLVGERAYLDRYWRLERAVAAAVLARATTLIPVDPAALRRSVHTHLPGPDQHWQRVAAAMAATRPICLLVGGPGTGKTTTIAQIVQVLYDICDEPPHIGLAAPTGKAATRMQSSLADRLAVTAPATSSPMLIGLRARTVHGLLGMRPGRPPRFNAANPLPHDVVIVDETSMVSLTHLAAVLAATRPDARLILVGDPDQLASVDVGAVLADLVNRPVDPAHLAAARLPAVFASGGGDGTEPGDSVTGQFPDPADVARAVTRLRIGWRFTRPIAELAEAIRGADEDMVGRFLDRYRAGREPGSGPGTGSAVRWWPLAADQLGRLTEDDLPVLAGDVRGQHRRVLAAASCGDAREALRALQSHQILTAHRQGPFGAQRWAHLASPARCGGIQRPGHSQRPGHRPVQR
ncbi:MAG: exodeoxyribonuclease V subunit alpha [Micrococcales bacterium]|nr:MAG: exodeoxyribonuclease V subunit alpha [Micrococcales bacterium]